MKLLIIMLILYFIYISVITQASLSYDNLIKLRINCGLDTFNYYIKFSTKDDPNDMYIIRNNEE